MATRRSFLFVPTPKSAQTPRYHVQTLSTPQRKSPHMRKNGESDSLSAGQVPVHTVREDEHYRQHRRLHHQVDVTLRTHEDRVENA
ncbi:hypothetical protein C8Q74DRAFT_1263798 [Fomes fomentarius]|nr:hypothetical protein C8Q74DRAFT_1263798 [Fomes fomentarius]